jgi:hypothetical protein
MSLIEHITIGGFRGILEPLTLDFVKGKTTRSMVIYGRNGTGKSSITDAWEWFHTVRIEHLAREGAGPSSYPHRGAEAGETFVEVQFVDEELDAARLDFDHKRITMPVPDGDIPRFRARAPHPCHIRFEDLTRFVYFTKAEKYDELARLMGFTPQVEFQKALRRVLRQLHDELEARERSVEDLEDALSELLELEPVTENTVLASLNDCLARHEIEPATSTDTLAVAATKLKLLVEDDARSQELAGLTTLRNAVQRLKLPGGLEANLRSYVELADAFKQEQEVAVDLLLIRLYEQGESVLTTRQELGQDIGTCPLCGQTYEGDLLSHILSELSRLRELKTSRDKLETARKKNQRLLRQLGDFPKRLREDCDETGSVGEEWNAGSLITQAEEVEKHITTFKGCLRVQPEKVDAEVTGSLKDTLADFRSAASQFQTGRDSLEKRLTKRITALEEDTSRAQLVDDHTTVRSALTQWSRLAVAREQFARLSSVYECFERVVEDYVESSIENVETRFEVISADVQTYFGILEEQTKGLGQPQLKLLRSQDRAVVLEVEFHGEPIYPAYRYLSESQLNSFGLAVFLASAKHFNCDFKFLILDDVINSFDAYKRPQVIRLLKQELPEHQVLLMTHDKIWCDRLAEECPTWVRHKFVRLEPAVGPIVREGGAPLSVIKDLIGEDEPVRAGRNMGPFLERQLQQLCESFEVMVKYNQRNEYTLDPLLDRFRMRAKGKLGQDHPLCEAIQALQVESGFRNLCAHWKNPATPITSPEMQSVVERWEAIADLVRCPGCHRFLRYDGKGFSCASPGCSTQLRRI